MCISDRNEALTYDLRSITNELRYLLIPLENKQGYNYMSISDMSNNMK